jgi:hypothetical protein
MIPILFLAAAMGFLLAYYFPLGSDAPAPPPISVVKTTTRSPSEP